MTINLNVGIDPDTGLAYIWDKNGFGRKPFIQGEHVVPEQFREYLVQRGSHFHSYIQKFSDDVNLVDIERFLDNYPSWSSVESDIERDGNDYRPVLKLSTPKGVQLRTASAVKVS